MDYSINTIVGTIRLKAWLSTFEVVYWIGIYSIHNVHTNALLPLQHLWTWRNLQRCVGKRLELSTQVNSGYDLKVNSVSHDISVNSRWQTFSNTCTVWLASSSSRYCWSWSAMWSSSILSIVPRYCDTLLVTCSGKSSGRISSLSTVSWGNETPSPSPS